MPVINAVINTLLTMFIFLFRRAGDICLEKTPQ